MDKPGRQQWLARSAADDHRPLVVLSANSSWNLLNFREVLIDGFEAAGYRLAAFVPEDSHGDDLRARGIAVTPMPLARSGMNPFADASLLLRYRRALKALKPAAYCSFTIKPNVYGCAAARMAGVPSIANVTGLGTMFLSGSLAWRLAASLYRWAFRKSHRVFFENEEDLGLFVSQTIIRPDQGRSVPGAGMDLDKFAPSDEPESGLRFLFIGRALRDKGFREYAEAARALRARFPEARFQVLGGPDPENRTSVSEAEFRSWIDEGLIEHLGEHADVRPFIQSASAIVLPSYREGMSRALLEGAAMAKPLIGSNVAGCRELIQEGVTGTLCEPRDAVSLAQAMGRIARLSPDQRRELGRAARRKVEREFSKELVVEAYLEALAQVSRP